MISRNGSHSLGRPTRDRLMAQAEIVQITGRGYRLRATDRGGKAGESTSPRDGPEPTKRTHGSADKNLLQTVPKRLAEETSKEDTEPITSEWTRPGLMRPMTARPLTSS